ncbi:MAG: hypothetical protein KDC87_20920 [Planctomycetes bacterium]|nr:hypothetical protein [Planctomycetota bacterium]
MYTSIPVGVWDAGRQALFLAPLAAVSAFALSGARPRGRWGSAALSALRTALGCAFTVLGIHACSTAWCTERMKQVPEFILDYTHHGYTAPRDYFRDHYWALVELQAVTWGIGVLGLVVVGTAFGIVAAAVARRRADRHPQEREGRG